MLFEIKLRRGPGKVAASIVTPKKSRMKKKLIALLYQQKTKKTGD